MVACIEIAGRTIGPGHPCFIIAEAGVNHNGELELAHKLIDAAADAGADAVKFQTWITEKLCQPGAHKADYQQVQSPTDADQYTLLKRLELPYAWHAELKAHAEQCGLVFLSTPDEIDSARFLCQLGVPAIKIGSGELTNLPYLRELAELNHPLILSTGMGFLEEVARALDAIWEIRTVPVVVLHCVSAYPAPEEEMNLRCIATLRESFGIPVGLSDHTVGPLAATLGVGLDMAVLEKHLTLDRTLPGPDHAASADPGQFSELVRTVRWSEIMMGTGVKALTPGESSTRQAVQRTLLYAADLHAGDVIRAEALQALRCGKAGLPPEAADRLQGRTLRHAVRTGELVSEDDFV